MLEKKYIILAIIACIISACLFAFVIYKQIEIANNQKSIEGQIVKQRELTDNIVVSISEYATKDDIIKFIKDNGVNVNAIIDDLKRNNATINSVNQVISNSGGYKKDNVPSTHSEPGNSTPPTVDCNGTKVACPDPYGFLKNRQDLVLQERFDNSNVPIGEVGFSSWRENPWNVNILPRRYSLTSVVGTDENNKNYFYNKFSVEVEGKKYDLKINNSITKQELPEARINWWNPRLFLNTIGGINLNDTSANINIGISTSFISYGKFKNQPNFNVLQLGLGYNVSHRDLNFIINPINYNIGSLLPNGVINNTYVGPSVALGASKTFIIGINASLGF